MDAPPIKRPPQITNLRKPIWLRGAVMGISRFPIRPGVYLRNINSARPRGPFFFNRQRGAAHAHLVKVTSGNGAFHEKWYAVGISRIRYAEAAVCALPEIKPTDVVVALRKLTPVENCCNRRGPSADCFVDQWKRRSS